MMKRFLPFLFALAALGPLRAQLLYEISGNGLRQRSYLFAQERLLPASFLDSVPQLLFYYGKTQCLILETNLNRVEDQRSLLQAARADSALYTENLSDAERSQLDFYIYNGLRLHASSWMHMQPALLLSELRDVIYRDSLGFLEDRSMENFFQFLANEQGHPILGLDQLPEATRMMFHRIPAAQQVRLLVQLMQHPEREASLGRELIQTYRRGDLTGIAYLLRGPLNQSTLAYADYAAYMDRNKRWTEALRAPMQEQGCFLMLDAEYLGGEQGLLSQLRRAGYRVKPVK